MFHKVLLLCAVVLCCEAAGYGSSRGSSSGGYSSGSSRGGYSSSGSREGGYSSGGYSSGSYGSSFSGGSSSGSVASGPVQAAVRSRHTIEYVDVDLPQDDIAPQVVEVDAGVLPLILNFKSASSRIQVHQSHEGSEAGEIQETQSEDEPQLLRHSVTKPIIQEVREVITPYRRVVQEIRPVEEEVKTIVSRGKGRKQGDFGGDSGKSYGTGSRSSGGYSSGGSYGSSSFASSRSKSY